MKLSFDPEILLGVQFRVTYNERPSIESTYLGVTVANTHDRALPSS